MSGNTIPSSTRARSIPTCADCAKNSVRPPSTSTRCAALAIVFWKNNARAAGSLADAQRLHETHAHVGQESRGGNRHDPGPKNPLDNDPIDGAETLGASHTH